MSEMQVEEFDFSGSVGAERAAESSKSGFSRRVEFLSLKADPASIKQGKDKILLRFLTDYQRRGDKPMDRYNIPWITAAQHYSKTRLKPDWVEKDANWPEKMGAGCRKDPIFAKKFNNTCLLCSRGEKSSNRIWALAVEREQITDDTGRVVGIKDKTREVAKIGADGKVVKDGEHAVMETVPAYIVMSMGWRNFFSPLNGQAAYFGTLLESDYLITRTGTENNDTNYATVRIGPISLPEDNEYGLPVGTVYDLSDPEFKAKVYPDMPDLRQIVADRVSDAYFGRWFTEGWAPPEQQGQSGSGSATPAASGAPAAPQTPTGTGSTEPAPDALAALQQRMMQQQ